MKTHILAENYKRLFKESLKESDSDSSYDELELAIEELKALVKKWSAGLQNRVDFSAIAEEESASEMRDNYYEVINDLFDEHLYDLFED